MSKIEVTRITLFGKIVAGSNVSLDDFEKQLDGKLVSETEAELFKIFKSVVFDITEILSKLHGSRFERLVDFDISVFDVLVNIRNRLANANTDLRKDGWFLFWDIRTYSTGYKLPIAIIEVTDNGWANSFETEFLLNYNLETKMSNVGIELAYRKYISFNQPYLTDYNTKHEIARKLFRSPTTGVVEVEVLTNQ
jgi:hypothetical protein